MPFLATSIALLRSDRAHIWLIGMMGAGKTATGAALAQRLDRPFVDIDDLVESQAGASVRTIFETAGEETFRSSEHEAVAIAARTATPGVIATGGGVVLDAENVEEMRRSGEVVLLVASVGTLSSRVARAGSRPLLDGGPLDERLDTLLAERDELYRRAAHHVVETEGLTIEETAVAVEAVCHNT